MLSSHQKRQILGCAHSAAAPRGIRQLGSALLLVLSLGSLAGCGQKGPLYLPGNPAGGATSPAPLPYNLDTSNPNNDLNNTPAVNR